MRINIQGCNMSKTPLLIVFSPNPPICHLLCYPLTVSSLFALFFSLPYFHIQSVTTLCHFCLYNIQEYRLSSLLLTRNSCPGHLSLLFLLIFPLAHLCPQTCIQDSAAKIITLQLCYHPPPQFSLYIPIQIPCLYFQSPSRSCPAHLSDPVTANSSIQRSN